MDLHDGIEAEVLEYLLLEFGENSSDPDALKLADLRYEGEFEIDGIGRHFWWFPCTSVQCWATVEPWDDTYLISMTTDSPHGGGDA